jgi:hypothetical protein
MEKRFGIIFGGLIAFAMLFYASFSIIKGGLLDLATAGILIAPFIFMIFLSCRRFWHVLIPVFLVASVLRIPIYGLEKLSLIFVLLLAATFVLILDRTLHFSKGKGGLSWEDRAVLILALILTGRLIHDRPGFVALGMAEGGFISSVTFVMASWFYFPVKQLVSAAVFSRRQLILAAWGVLAVGVIGLAQAEEGVLILRYVGGPPFWMLCAMSISLLATSTKQNRQTLWFYAVSFIFLALGVLSTFRSRTFFFLSEIMAVSWLMKWFKRSALIIGCGGVLGVLLLIGVLGEVPEIMKRFLSLFMDVGSMHMEGSSGAMGWEDSFRWQLLQVAWTQIKLHPFFGNGFGLNVAQAVGILTVGVRTEFNLLALSGAYHNSIAAVAVKAGLPAAILFSAVLLSSAVRFVKMLFRTEQSDFRTWGMAVFAFWCANFFYILMNGGAEHYFNGMILSGYMMGMMRNPAAMSRKPEVRSQESGVRNQKAKFSSRQTRLPGDLS